MRRRIVAGATSAFAERGFFGASMRDIALRVGITEGRLYRYFAHKAGLLDAMASDAAARGKSLLDAVIALAHEESDLRRFMHAYAKLCLADLDEYHDWHMLWLQQPPLSEVRAAELNDLAERICGVVADTIRARTRACDPALAAAVFSGALLTQSIFVRRGVGVAALSDDLATRLVNGWLPGREP